MFHIAKKVYLEYDYAFENRQDFILSSSRWSERFMLSVNGVADPTRVPTFSELLQENFNNKIEDFWKFLLNKNNKFVVYVDSETLTSLQIQYWRSIFENITPESVHILHTSWVESKRLHGYFEKIGSWTKENKWSRANALTDLKFLTLDEIKVLYQNNPPIDALKNIDKSKVSFEYLLADYLADNSTPYKNELFNRVKILTWENWLDELEHLKYEILSGTIDAGQLDPSINVGVGKIESELAKSNILKWTVDPAFGQDIDYIRSTYNYEIFNPCWIKLAEIWDVEYDDMSELNRLVNTDKYEELLMRDINRKYGCSYTRTRFMNKCNQVFATWCYDRKRSNKTNDLSNFKLKRP